MNEDLMSDQNTLCFYDALIIIILLLSLLFYKLLYWREYWNIRTFPADYRCEFRLIQWVFEFKRTLLRAFFVVLYSEFLFESNTQQKQTYDVVTLATLYEIEQV